MLLACTAPGPSTLHPLRQRQCGNSGRLAGRGRLRGEGLQAVSQRAGAGGAAPRRSSALPAPNTPGALRAGGPEQQQVVAQL